MEERKRKRSSSPASASGTKKNAVSSNPLVKVSTDSSTKKKNAVASASKMKNVVASDGKKKNVVASDAAKSGKMKEAVASDGGKKDDVASQGVKKKATASPNSDEDPPEEMSDNTAYKNSRIHKNIPKNPFHCPDINANKWTQKDKDDYYNWLSYERDIRGLTLAEQEYMQTLILNEASESKLLVSLRKYK